MVIRRSTILVVVLLALGVLSALMSNQVAAVGLLQGQEEAALKLVAEREGVPVAQLKVVNSATATYPVQGKTAGAFKVAHKTSGAMYGVTLDKAGKAVNPAQLDADELKAHDAKYGKLDPALAEQLAGAAADAPIEVMIWLKEATYTGPQRPVAQVVTDESGEVRVQAAGGEEALTAFFAAADSQRTKAVEGIVAPVAARLTAMEGKANQDKGSRAQGNGGYNVRTETLAPVVYANLSPKTIGEVAKWSEVEQVSQVLFVEPTQDIARLASKIQDVWVRHLDGSGVTIGQVEVGGRVSTANPFLTQFPGFTQDATFVCAGFTPHATAVAGIHRSRHLSFFGGAPATRFWAGGSCSGSIAEVQNRVSAASAFGARAINMSLGGDFALGVTTFDRFHEGIVRNSARTLVISAGNSGAAGRVGSPAKAYNVIAVGSYNDLNTPNPPDVMSAFSSSVDPTSLHNDREKPEVAAPGENFIGLLNASPFVGNIGSGTSYSAPITNSVAALLMQRAPVLQGWPEGVKAILMTSATNNIEGAPRLSERDGAGGIFADRADDIARGLNGNFGLFGYSCATPSPLNVATIPMVAGQRLRVTWVFDTDPANAFYFSRPSADLDLQILNPAGGILASSASFDNTYEIVDITSVPTTGNYTARIIRFSCLSSPGFAAVAWRRGS